MVSDDLEPGPSTPHTGHTPRSRRPATEPARVDDALRSYQEDRWYAVRRPDRTAARKVTTEIKAAVYYLRRWKGYDIRVRPNITEHYTLDGVEYTHKDQTDKVPEHWFVQGYKDATWTPDEFRALVKKAREVDHYWKANFWVHDPLNRGFRQMDSEQHEDLLRASAASRGVDAVFESDRRAGVPRRTARTVEQRG